MSDQKPRAIISAILQKKDKNGEGLIYLQERWKPKVSPTYSGMIEIPAGGIDGYENVYDALKREVKEECGLDIIKVINDFQSEVYEYNKKDKSFVFKPFICQQVLSTNGGLPWIGFVFVCEVAGIIKINKNEAKNPCWMNLKELKKLLHSHPEKIFPLQVPVLRHYVENYQNKFSKINNFNVQS